MSKITVNTPAKLNLGLQVGRERSDGFHNIHTIFQTIGLFDRLTIRFTSTRSDDLTVTGRTAGVPTDDSNLLFRVLERVRSRGIEVPGCDMELHKEIPTQAGLGGASSDAAALLRILQYRFVQKDECRFEQVAREVGADVLFLLKGGTLEATGRGDQFRSMPELDGWALVVVPPYGVETEWAYRQLENRNLVGEELDARNESLDAEHWRDLNLTNDFVPLISEEEPLQDRLLSRLGEFTDHCSLTGSGSALYGLFETKREGRKAQEALGESFQETEFELVTFIGRNDIPKLEREVPCRSQ